MCEVLVFEEKLSVESVFSDHCAMAVVALTVVVVRGQSNPKSISINKANLGSKVVSARAPYVE